MIDPAAFRRFAPSAMAGTLRALEAAAARFGIADRLELAHWLGQMRVESAGFSRMSENLNYSPEGLIATFGARRISPEDAARFGRITGRPANQNAIANIVYGGAWGAKNLGNTQPGDGWRFRGGGFKQITGRDNYREAGHEADPDALRLDVQASADAAANFWIKHGCGVPARLDNVEAVTRIINGGDNGLAARIAATRAAKRLLGVG